jgi:16S rRNA processing protein RimM
MHSDSDKPDYALVGKILKAQGIKGEVKVLPFSGAPDDLLGITSFELRQGRDVRKFKVDKSRCHGKYLVAKFTGIDDRNMSETLAGFEVWVPEDALPELEPDEFYWHEMQGLQVVTAAGRSLGKVTSLMTTGAHDVLVIKGGGQEFLVPAANDIIVKLDKQDGVLVIDPPPGLLEINDSDAF